LTRLSHCVRYVKRSDILELRCEMAFEKIPDVVLYARKWYQCADILAWQQPSL